MQSLRDKLLQAGLVTKEQVDRAKEGAERKAKPPPRPAQAAPPPPRESEKDKERRLNRELADRQKQVRAICDASEIIERGEVAFFFRTRRRELRRMYLLPAQMAALEKGDLAIVDRPNGQDRPHSLIPRAAADQILPLEPRAIRFWARAPGESYGFEDGPEEGAPGVDEPEAGEPVAEVAPPTSPESSG